MRIAAWLLPGYGDEQFAARTVLYSVLPCKEFQGATRRVAQHLWKVNVFFNSSASLQQYSVEFIGFALNLAFSRAHEPDRI